MPSRTTTARGLGWSHRQARAHLLRVHTEGTACWWCGQPMFRDPDMNPDGRALEADHSHARARGGHKADRLLHMTCNRQRGDGSRDHLRPVLTGQDLGHEGIGHTVLPWP